MLFGIGILYIQLSNESGRAEKNEVTGELSVEGADCPSVCLYTYFWYFWADLWERSRNLMSRKDRYRTDRALCIKCTIAQALRLCTGRTVRRGSRGIALPFHDHGTRRCWAVGVTPLPLYPEKDPVPIVKEAGWSPGPVRIGTENLAPTGIRSPDRPARRQSVFLLSYRDHSLGIGAV